MEKVGISLLEHKATTTSAQPEPRGNGEEAGKRRSQNGAPKLRQFCPYILRRCLLPAGGFSSRQVRFEHRGPRAIGHGTQHERKGHWTTPPRGSRRRQ